MIRAHVIALDPTIEQSIYFARACGVARFAYNWALSEWKRQYESGEKPSALALKKRWNAVRRAEFPWSLDVTKCAGSQAIMNLGTAFGNFFRDRKKTGRKSGFPNFKKKGKRDSFALWNDQFDIAGHLIRVPKLGAVRMREALRFDGKILGAIVSRRAGRWFVSVQVEVADPSAAHGAPGSVVGVDLGIKALMTCSDGTVIANRSPCKSLMARQKRLQRRISRQRTRSKRQIKRRAALAKLHCRIANIRSDAIHKATSWLCRTFETVALEDLNVAGMVKNHSLAGAISDAAFGEIRRQCEYKSAASGGRTVIADRWYPSSKACSECGSVKPTLSLGTRIYRCDDCGSVKCRDRNAADNLEKVGRAPAEPTARAVNARGHRSSGRAKARGETAVDEPRTQLARMVAHK